MEKSTAPKPLPYIEAFEQLGFGMFVHWGLYSQLKKGEWVYSTHQLKAEDYFPLIESFRVKTVDEIVNTAKSAGCKYICVTTRHHEGFSLYDTRGLSDFDIMHSPTGRDIIREFCDACRAADIVPFFYHTTLDWHHPDFNNDFDAYLDYLYKSVEILCTHYGKIGGIWFDGNWSKPDADWQEEKLYQMIRRLQPEAIINNNTGLHARGAFGQEEIDSLSYERGKPGVVDQTGRAKYVAREMSQTLCDHWGVADDINFKSVKQLIEELCECRKVGAQFLLNIGPNADGSVSTMQKGIMESIGRWMSLYGKSIYNGRPYLSYENTRDFLLKDVKDPNTAYLFRLDPGQSSGDANVSLGLNLDGAVTLDGFDRTVASITWMDNGEAVSFRQQGDQVSMSLNGYRYGQSLCVRVAEVKFN